MSQLKYNVMKITLNDVVVFNNIRNNDNFYRCVYFDSIGDNIRFISSHNGHGNTHSRGSTNKECFLVFPGKFHKENEVLNAQR